MIFSLVACKVNATSTLLYLCLSLPGVHLTQQRYNERDVTIWMHLCQGVTQQVPLKTIKGYLCSDKFANWQSNLPLANLLLSYFDTMFIQLAEYWSSSTGTILQQESEL